MLLREFLEIVRGRRYLKTIGVSYLQRTRVLDSDAQNKTEFVAYRQLK